MMGYVMGYDGLWVMYVRLVHYRVIHLFVNHLFFAYICLTLALSLCVKFSYETLMHCN